MKRRIVTVTILAALAALSACNFSFSSAAISDVKMGKGVNDKMEVQNATTTFDGTEKEIHCVVSLSYAPPNTKVKAEWIIVKAEGQKPNDKIGETTVEAGGDKQVVDFHLTPSAGGLPAGEYRVDLYLNPDPSKQAQPDKTVSFTVKGSAAGAASVEITSALLSTDEGGEETATVFPEGTEKIYCLVKLDGVRDGAKITARWVTVHAGGEADRELERTPLTLESGKNIVKFSLKAPNGFPAGNYKIEIFLGDSQVPKRTLEFQIEEE